MEKDELHMCMFAVFGEARWQTLQSWLDVNETNAKRWFFGEKMLPDHLQTALRSSAAEVENIIRTLDTVIETARARGVDDMMIAHRLRLYAKNLPDQPRPRFDQGEGTAGILQAP